MPSLPTPREQLEGISECPPYLPTTKQPEGNDGIVFSCRVGTHWCPPSYDPEGISECPPYMPAAQRHGGHW